VRAWKFFYIYFITIFQKYMVRHKFCKNIHLPSPWATAAGVTRSGPLAPTPRATAYVPNAVARGVRGLTPGVSVALR
jgi:hypothetical protein